MYYNHVPSCSCGTLRVLLAYQQHQHVMHLLMGLNEGFHMYVDKSYSWILFYPSISFLAKETYKSNLNKQHFRKNRLVCTRCGLANYMIDKCYKFHGFPLGYKMKGKKSLANQVFSALCASTPLDLNTQFSILHK